VSGKGAAAALYGGLMNGLLRTLAPRNRRPAALLRALNEALILRKVEARYATLTVLLWDPATRQIVMANSDGITDHLNAAGHEYGRGRLAQVIRSGCRRTAADLIAAIFGELDKFNTTAFDDQTVFVMKVK
jgi:serine phosphatase RsbU (regulator of sigma subunit)